ncbi:MAG: response regulator [Calditrichia bacterium]|nr:response regulator [Calditrichia bacterium]
MKTVLIVDDEKAFLSSVIDGLKDFAEDFKVLTAINGEEALEILENQNINLVLTDINMPKMDGFQLLTHMNNSYSSIPVIVMTAFGSDEIMKKTEELGATLYLEKPMDLNELIPKINDGLALGSKGYIQGISLPSFLQLLSIEKKSCILNVKCKNNTGKLFLNRGSIIDAETKKLNGVEAAYEIIGWENIDIVIEYLHKHRKKTIDSLLNHIIIEALRLKDEKTEASRTQSKSKIKDTEKNKKGTKNKVRNNKADQKTTKLEDNIVSVQEKLKEFAAIDGFGGVGLFTPAGENLVMLKAPDFKADLQEIGVLANNVLMNAQKTALEMGVGRGQLVHVEAESAHFIVRCLNEGTDPLKSQPGKTHIHMVLILTNDSSIGMAKLKVNSIVKSLADDFRE